MAIWFLRPNAKNAKKTHFTSKKTAVWKLECTNASHVDTRSSHELHHEEKNSECGDHSFHVDCAGTVDDQGGDG